MAAGGVDHDHPVHGLQLKQVGSTEMDLILSRRAARLRGGRAGVSRVHAPASGSDSPGASEPERPWGCGWFDSSLDLRQGLAVIEHPTIDLTLAEAVQRLLCPERAG